MQFVAAARDDNGRIHPRSGVEEHEKEEESEREEECEREEKGHRTPD